MCYTDATQSLLFSFSLCRCPCRLCSSRVNFWPGSLQLFAAVFTLFCKGTFWRQAVPNNKRRRDGAGAVMQNRCLLASAVFGQRGSFSFFGRQIASKIDKTTRVRKSCKKVCNAFLFPSKQIIYP